MELIGLGYKARAGKDSVANHLRDVWGFSKMSFAAPLKKACRAIFGWSVDRTQGANKEEVDPFWGISPREAMQQVGTELFRQQFGEDVWVKSFQARLILRLKSVEETARKLDITGLRVVTGRIVVTDVRFPNEAEAIRRLGGKVVRVDRLGGRPTTAGRHLSETAMEQYDSWDGTIFASSGDMNGLRESARTVVCRLFPGLIHESGKC